MRKFFKIIQAQEFWQILARSDELKVVTDVLAVMSCVFGVVWIFCVFMCLYKFNRKDKVCLKYQDVVYKIAPAMYAVSGAFILAWTIIAFC